MIRRTVAMRHQVSYISGDFCIRIPGMTGHGTDPPDSSSIFHMFELDNTGVSSNPKSVSFSERIDIKTISRAPTLDFGERSDAEGDSQRPAQQGKPIPSLDDQARLLAQSRKFEQDIHALCMVDTTNLWSAVERSPIADTMYNELSNAVVFGKDADVTEQRRLLWGLICQTIQNHVLAHPKFHSHQRLKRQMEACWK